MPADRIGTTEVDSFSSGATGGNPPVRWELRDRRASQSFVLFLFYVFGSLTFVLPSAPPPVAGEADPPHRSPLAVVVSPDGRRAFSANSTSNSLSLFDPVAGKLITEVPCGRHPIALALSRDGRRLAAACLREGTVDLFDFDPAADRLARRASVAVGFEPRSASFTPDGREVLCAVGGTDEVVALAFDPAKVTRRHPAHGKGPRAAALSSDGATLAVACSRSATLALLNARTGAPVRIARIDDAANLNGLAFSADGKHVVATHITRREFPVARENIAMGWVIDNRLSRVPLEPSDEAAQLALDPNGLAVGDPHAVAFSPDGKFLAVTAAGTHELLLFAAGSIPWEANDVGDHIDASLLAHPDRFRRVDLGGRPTGVAFTPDSRCVLVANALADCVHVVDAASGRLLRTVALGGPANPSPARRGEAVFYDAMRSHNQWFSCNTCHLDGHTNGLLFDTLNDDSYGNPKLTPSLRGVGRTGPWTWHGLQSDLETAVEKSLTTTMQAPKPTAQTVADLAAFLRSLEHPANPHRGTDGALSPSAKRGLALFAGKGNCAVCHAGPEFTSASLFEVGTGRDGSPHAKWNPPSLRGLHARSRFLHDGRCDSLDELLRIHHDPAKLGGEPLTSAERAELVAYLNSL